MYESSPPAQSATPSLGFGTYFIKDAVLYRYVRPVIDGPPYYTEIMDTDVQDFV